MAARKPRGTKERSIERAKDRMLVAVRPVPSTREHGPYLCFVYERFVFTRLADGTTMHASELEREYVRGPFPDHIRLAIGVGALAYECFAGVAPP